jgi:hypothetical protein
MSVWPSNRSKIAGAVGVLRKNQAEGTVPLNRYRGPPMTLANTRANVPVCEDADKSPGLTRAEAQRGRGGSLDGNSLDSRGGDGRHPRHNRMVVSGVTVAVSPTSRMPGDGTIGPPQCVTVICTAGRATAGPIQRGGARERPLAGYLKDSRISLISVRAPGVDSRSGRLQCSGNIRPFGSLINEMVFGVLRHGYIVCITHVLRTCQYVRFFLLWTRRLR